MEPRRTSSTDADIVLSNRVACKQWIGVFRSGPWWLDRTGDHAWINLQDIFFRYGYAGDIPVLSAGQ
jgi:hypothetical protein